MATQPHFLGSMTLKALLEDPNLKNPPLIAQSSSQLKVKKEDDSSSDLPQFNYGSAFLGPNLWDKTYDGLDFNLEYMDLEEFLSENGIADADEAAKNTQLKSENSNSAVSSLQVTCPPAEYTKTPPMSPSQFLLSPPAKSQQFIPVAAGSVSPSRSNKSPSPPVSPFNVEFQMTEQDLALSSIPDYGDDYCPKWQLQTNGSHVNTVFSGQEDFDPRRRNFSEEELKPQPILKKSKKVFVPEDLKDDKYWARRHKNNYAAKRSRDARRVKENQIAMRAAFLEKENSALRDEVNKLRKENVKLKTKVLKYEPTAELDTPTSSSGVGIP